MELQNKVAIVTGASGGIGRCIALALAEKGVRVELIARDPGRLQKVADEIREGNGVAFPFPADIRSVEQVEALVADAQSRFGAVDILVNSAFWGPPGSIEETDEAFWDQTLDTTLKAPFLLARAVAPLMKRQKGGRIVNIGSLAGKTGEDNRTAYCAAKWGLEGLTAALAAELTRYNIHVHLISPAATHTQWWYGVGANLTEQAVERMIPPEVIAGAVCWVLTQPDQVHIPDVPVYNFRPPFEGKGSPFER